MIPPPSPIHGLVVDEGGQPVEGVELFLTALTNRSRINSHPTWKARSDAQGRFLMDRSKAWLEGISTIESTEGILAYRPGSKVAGVSIGLRPRTTAANPLRIVLRRAAAAAASVPLRVVGPDGGPVEDARIRISGPSRPTMWPDELRDRLSVTTGADGRARFEGLAKEDLGVCSVESKAFGKQVVFIKRSAKVEQLLTLRAVGKLLGRVVVDPPEQAEGLTIEGDTYTGLLQDRPIALGGSFRASTNAEGRFEVPALAPGTLVSLSPTGNDRLFIDRSRLSPVQVEGREGRRGSDCDEGHASCPRSP